MEDKSKGNANLAFVATIILVWFGVGFVVGGIVVWAWNPLDVDGFLRVFAGFAGGMILFTVPGFLWDLGWSLFTREGRKAANEEWEKREQKRFEKRQRRQANPIRQSIIKAFFWDIGFGAGRSLTDGNSQHNN